MATVAFTGPKSRTPVYQTDFGEAWAGDAFRLFKGFPDESIDLIFTSPPYALLKKKKYGNVSSSEYVKWFTKFADRFHRKLKPTGSLVVNIGGAWTKGSPTKSLYPYKLLLALCEPQGNRRKSSAFHLAQEFYWFSPGKMPLPAQWVTIRQMRVKEAVEHIWWLSKTEFPKADNNNVLVPYSKSMEALLRTSKYNRGPRPGGSRASNVWDKRRSGAIPPNFMGVEHGLVKSGLDVSNLVVASNTGSNDTYRKRWKAAGMDAHPATFPQDVPRFFIELLTEKGDFVVDPFAGSNTTGFTAERLGRSWVAFDLNASYLEASALRWDEHWDRLNGQVQGDFFEEA